MNFYFYLSDHIFMSRNVAVLKL